MKLITPFDPSMTTSGTIETLGININEQLMLYNDSLYGIQLKFADGSIDVIPPSWNKDFIIKNVAMGKVEWSIYNQIIATGYPISQVYGTLYENGEHVASVNAGMQRGFTLTGGGGVVLSTANSLVSDNQPTGTEFIESTVQGAPGSTIIVKNDGTLTIAELIANVVTPFLQSFPGQSTILKIGENNKITQLLGQSILGSQNAMGNLALNNVITLGIRPTSISNKGIVIVGNVGQTANLFEVQDNTFTDIFTVDAVGNVIALATQLKSDGVHTDKINALTSGGDITFNNTIGTSSLIIHDNLAGISLGRNTAGDTFDGTSTDLFAKAINGGFRFQSPSGTNRWSIQRMNGNGNTTCGSGTIISHGLGALPDVVIATPRIAQPGSATVGTCSWSTTSFTATVGLGSAISWLAINF